MNSRLSMVFVHTTRLGEMTAFYSERLGLVEKWRDEGQSVWFDTGAATLVLHAPEGDLNPGPFEPASGGVLLWLEVDDAIEDRYRALVEGGVTIVMPLRRAPSRSIFVVADPEGRRIGFFASHSDPPAVIEP